jgi:hypothetical protein
MALRLLYLIVSRLLDSLTPLSRAAASKNIELLVLCHEVAVHLPLAATQPPHTHPFARTKERGRQRPAASVGAHMNVYEAVKATAQQVTEDELDTKLEGVYLRYARVDW